MTAVDLLLSRLDKPRQSGRDRWRCACPVCGERNRSTLSVGVGNTGATLLTCWKSGCSPDQIAAALGLEIEDLFPPRDASAPPMKPRRLISANQALDVLEMEMNVVLVVACDMRKGLASDDKTQERLLQSIARITLIKDEVRL